MNKELETSVMLIEAINSAVKKINTAKEKNNKNSSLTMKCSVDWG